MTYASRLVRTQELRNWPKPPSMDLDTIDRILDEKEKMLNRRRSICPVCMTQTSTSGSCFC